MLGAVCLYTVPLQETFLPPDRIPPGRTKWSQHRDYPGNRPAVVDIKDVDYWPNVSNGLYTKENAMAFFNEYFEGNSLGKI